MITQEKLNARYREVVQANEEKDRNAAKKKFEHILKLLYKNPMRSFLIYKNRVGIYIKELADKFGLGTYEKSSTHECSYFLIAIKEPKDE
jgi:hypothetical protein